MKKIRKDESEPLLVPKGYEFVGEPYRHQVVTFMHGLHHKDLAILSTMGTGKTYCAISLARYWIQQGEAKRILVVCPSSVLFNWKDEVEKFSEYDAHVLHSGKSISREGRIKLFSIPSTFYIINYEATLHYLKYILRLESDIVIFDESSRVANPKAKQTQACAKIASQTKYRYILNGTPIPNRPEGLWSQFYILDFGETLGPTYKIFKQCYFTTIKARSKAGKIFLYCQA
ncbi:MAG: DEAD/DEAH box helicase family protein [Candidatus Thorarchaeota archaeon]|nr:DEAD/DEAH box helicase family protein [Candidatus Thorarchaeota archaeon]